MPSNFEDNALIQELRRSYYGPDATAEQVWSEYKTRFVRKSLPERRQDLKAIDGWLYREDQPSYATREQAQFLQLRRELQDLDNTLSRIGR
jgi:transposase